MLRKSFEKTSLLENGLEFAIVFWFFWVAWVHTVGRLPQGLGVLSICIFDLGVGLYLFFLARRIYLAKSQAAVAALFPEPNRKLFFLSVLAVAVLCLCVLLQVPLDWDGMDYHLPPLAEALQKQRWGRSENPYFANRFYPKSSDLLHLWWLRHFAQWFGLRSAEVMGLLIWFVGLAASLLTIGKNKWVFIAWVAYPLVMRQAGTAYADLAGMATLLSFFFFATHKRPWLAALALGLHSSIKFNNLASGMTALGIAAGLALFTKEKKFGSLKTILIYILGFGLMGGIQPLENFLKEAKPFGPMKCIVLGHDYCHGTLDPADLVVSPTIDIPREWPVPMRILKGWMPSQAVPGSDLATGGFGLIWLISIPLGLFLLFRFFKKQPLPKVVLAFVFMAITDLVIPALWYQRYHMGLGWVFIMLAVLPMISSLFLPYPKLARFYPQLVSVIFAVQILWTIPSRNWFLGVNTGQDFQTMTRNILENLESILKNGHPRHFTHPADQRSWQLYALKEKRLVICGADLRPSLPAYGASLTNTVEWCGSTADLTNPCTVPPNGESPVIRVGQTIVYAFDKYK